MSFRDIYLVCFGAGTIIHAVQTALSAKLSRHRVGLDHVEAVDGIALGLTAFFWQFGNFLRALSIPDSSSNLFQCGNYIRDGSLVCFPLLFSYMCLHIPKDVRRGRSLLLFGQYLRFLLWPWTALALLTMVAGDAGFRYPIPFLSPNLTAMLTLHIMLVYFVIFTISSAVRRDQAKASGVAALVRAHKAAVFAGLLTVISF